MILSKEQSDFCKAMIFLFWWKKPEELVGNPYRTLAGVMDRGSFKEWEQMEKLFPPEVIIHVLETAKCGEFHNWSWKFWRLRYELDENAPLPARMPGVAPPTGEYWFKGLQKSTSKQDDEFERLKWTYTVRGIGV